MHTDEIKGFLSIDGRHIRDIFVIKIENDKIYFRTSTYLEPIDIPIQISIEKINNIYLQSCIYDDENPGSFICEGFFD